MTVNCSSYASTSCCSVVPKKSVSRSWTRQSFAFGHSPSSAALRMDPSAYSFRSLRAGHVTQARRNGASTEEIMRGGRWRKAETMNVYDREFNPAARNSVMRLGL
ncbi:MULTISPECIES: hypothetical protein [Streptomyces]|uniref:Tyr recombinase domain-containing protein n=2 Tax=Streptomyces TaxID=1883 RepID=A0ABV9J786_9ACTN